MKMEPLLGGGGAEHSQSERVADPLMIPLVESKSAMSIAIPLLSAGCVGVSRYLMAQVLIGELLAYRRFTLTCLVIFLCLRAG